jgi:transcriptional antiterminator
MFINKEDFEAWMERIMDRFDRLENRPAKEEKARHRIDGELLLDNQDLCQFLNVSKRTLQRYRSDGKLLFKRIDQKTYYLESDVHAFIRKNLK